MIDKEVFNDVNTYVEYGSGLLELSTYPLGTPLKLSGIWFYSILFDQSIQAHRKRVLKKVFKHVCKINGLKDMRLEITKGNKTLPAHYVLGKPVVYLDETFFRNKFYYSVYLICHEISHHLIYLNQSLNNQIMDLNKKFKNTYEITENNNLILPVELLANSVNNHLLANIKKDQKYLTLWFKKYQEEIKKIL